MDKMDSLLLEYRVENGRQAQALSNTERLHTSMDEDPKILAAQLHVDVLKEPYMSKIRKEEEILKNVDEHIAAIKDTIAKRWTLGTAEYKSPTGSITMRTTKSLIITSKEKVVEVLRNNGKVSEGIKAFQLTFLRKLKDVGILPDDAAYYSLKQSVVIALKKGGK